MADTPGKAFKAMAESKVVTNWAVIVLIIGVSFVAGKWATTMDNRIGALDLKITDFIGEYRASHRLAVDK